MTDHIIIDWRMVREQIDRMHARWANMEPLDVYGIPRGGVPVACLIAERMGLPLVDHVGEVSNRTLIVDDLIDSGATMRPWYERGNAIDVLYRKPHSPEFQTFDVPTLDGWLVFPWEMGTDDEGGPADAVVRLLHHIGEDSQREGLLDTPRRVLKSLSEMTDGYATDVGALLERTFDHDGYTGLVVCTGIDFVSLCEHHLLPFTGTAAVAYVPGTEDRKVVGLSKLARVVDAFAHRLQLQERMTEQIADALVAHLQPDGAGVVVRAHHACMSCRGVRKANAQMVTSSLRGLLFDDPRSRAEFMALAHTTA